MLRLADPGRAASGRGAGPERLVEDACGVLGQIYGVAEIAENPHIVVEDVLGFQPRILGDLQGALEDVLPDYPQDVLQLVAVRIVDRKSVRVGKECVSTCRTRWSPDH